MAVAQTEPLLIDKRGMGDEHQHHAEAQHLKADKPHGGSVAQYQPVVGHQGTQGCFDPLTGRQAAEQDKFQDQGQQRRIGSQKYKDQVPVAQRQHSCSK